MSNIGEVEIELGGKTEVLRPTLRAAKAVNSIGGDEGFAGVFRRIVAMDLYTITRVVAHGLGGKRKDTEVEELVYAAGVAKLAAPISEYVSILANGGKPLAADDDDGEKPAGEK